MFQNKVLHAIPDTMLKKFLLALSLFTLLCTPASVFAWGREGHQMVAQLAYQLLSSSAKEKLKALLGNTSIEDASTWMDEQRGGNNPYKYLTTTHYINIEKGGKIDPFQKGNIFTELNTVISELEKGNNPAEIKLNLMILIHLLGDVHQPLHDGYGNDKGGNSIRLSFEGRNTNLHSVWDGAIINRENITTQALLKNYSQLPPAKIKALKESGPADWIYEARTYLPQIYDFSNGNLDETYSKKAASIIEEQLLKAGIRLSAILEKVLANTKAPVTAAVQSNASQVSSAPITAAEAAHHVGEKITVCDKVYGTRFLENSNGQPTFLNMGAAYPNSPFTIVIFGRERANFSEKPEIYYNQKNVCATGLIKEYNGKPEMILSNQSEIKIVN